MHSRPSRPSRPILLACSSLFLVSAAACYSGHSHKAPTIESFTVTPGSLPYGGGAVTFSWSVRDAKTLDIEPDVGAVTGTSATVTITADGDYTLTATNGTGETSAKVHVLVGSTMTLAGTVRTALGPLPGATVIVLGEPGTTPSSTDSNGAFTIAGVLPPYDVAVVGPMPGPPFIFLYEGLTRPDPTLRTDWSPFALLPPVPHTGTQAGTLAQLTGFPVPGGTVDTVLIAPENGPSGPVPANTSDSSWTANWPFSGPVQDNLTVHALEYTLDGASRPDAFSRSGSASTVVTSNVAPPSLDVPLATVSTTTVSGAATVLDPVTMPPALVNVALAWDTHGGPAMTLPGMVATAATFSLHAPVVPGGEIRLLAQTSTPQGPVSMEMRGVTAGEGALEIALPAGVAPALPLNGAQVEPGTLMAWSAPPESVASIFLALPSGPVEVIVHGNSMRFPDLSEIGLVPFPNTSFVWGVGQVFGPFATLDDAAGPWGVQDSGATHFQMQSGIGISVHTPP